jgi:hypothetical protein
MTKALFEYCQRNLSAVIKPLKLTASLEKLYRIYGIGSLEGTLYYFDEKDKAQLIERVKEDHGVHLFREPYPDPKSRINNAQKNRNEKQNALTVTHDFVLINSLSSLRLNKSITEKSPINSLGSFICASEIKSIEHSHLVFVENLIVMANLPLLKIPESLKDALWLYRGDQKAQQNTGTANQFFKRFKKTNNLVCFSDLDPKGLEIALKSGATQWLTIADNSDLCLDLQGVENEWFNQKETIAFLSKLQLSAHQKMLFEKMKQTQKTLKQEHMIAHSLNLDLFELRT